MKLSRGARRDNLFCRFFSVSQRLNFIFAWNCLMFVPINSLSLHPSSQREHFAVISQHVCLEKRDGRSFSWRTVACWESSTLTGWECWFGKFHWLWEPNFSAVIADVEKQILRNCCETSRGLQRAEKRGDGLGHSRQGSSKEWNYKNSNAVN